MTAPGVASEAPPRGFVIERAAGQPQRPGSLQVNPRLSSWLSLAQPGQVQVFTGKVELGQGILTALQLIVAEELDLPLAVVHVFSASTVRGPDEGVTSGSLSIQDSGSALRHASAELRGMALQRAAQRGGVLVHEIEVQGGQFSVHGQALGDYWSLLSDADLQVDYQGLWAPKSAAQHRLIGHVRPQRLDLADKVFGRARYIHDMCMQGLLHGRVLRAPTLTARLAAWPPAAAATLPEGVRCWADGRFVAVVAPTEYLADTVAERLRGQLVWQPGEALPNASELPTFLRQAAHDTTVSAQRGAADAADAADPAGPADPTAWPSSGKHHRAAYFKPYLAHASIGPTCALAHWDGQRLALWRHSQGIHNLRDDLVLALSQEVKPLAKANIAIHHVEGAGCYGHNGADDVAFDAVLMALACPCQPVRVLWSRADELTHSPFGAAQAVELQARLDDSGRLTHWQHRLWANGYSSRPGRAKTPTLLAASERACATLLPVPINPPLAAGGGADRNAVPAYDVPHLRVLNHRLTVMPLRTSALRALGAFANVFAIESFVDELAQLQGEDPLAFRCRHWTDPRALAVLEAVVERSHWWSQPGQESPSADDAVGQGLAWARYKNTGAWCAVLARVSVGQQVRVLKLDLAVDVGLAVDLDGVINQIEGGAIQAVSWTLKEQVRFDAQGITSNDWTSYPVLRFSEAPEVVVHVIDRPDQPPLGAGEAAHGPVAAALANAVANALGVRVRSLPLDAEQLPRAVHAADAGTAGVAGVAGVAGPAGDSGGQP